MTSMPGRKRLYFALRTSRFAVGVALAACQPQATRLLLLDERLTDPASLEATARPWNAAGYTIEYRRYYPHLTRADLARYRTVIVLGGNAPGVEPPSNALTLGDLDILTEWLLRGGVVVLGYPSGDDGALDRWIMNQWLAWSGAGIAIPEAILHDSGGASPPALPIRETAVRELGLEAFPAGDYHPLRVSLSAQVLAQAGGYPARRGVHAPVVAARRIGDGLILVLSRSTLGALAGADQVVSQPGLSYEGTRAFLVGVARWTRRPAEWARVPPAAPRTPLAFGGAGAVGERRAAPSAPLAAPPQGVDIEILPNPAVPFADSLPARSALPSWATRTGLRALAGDFPALDHRVPASARARWLDSLADFLEAGAFNLLLTNAHGTALVDSSHWSRWDRDATRAAWEQTADRLDATSVRWIPVVVLRDFAVDSGFACPLDSRLWETVLNPGVRMLTRLAAAHRDVIPAIGVDLTGTPWAGARFCDAAWRAGLAEMTSDSGFPRDRAARLDSLPLTDRYDSLLAGGLLARYEVALDRAVAKRTNTLRLDAHRARRDLLFAVVADRSSADWFVRGFVAALGGADAPVMLFGPDDGDARSTPHTLRAVRLDPGRLGRIDASLARRVFHERDGFWLAPVDALEGGTAGDLIHQLRRFAKDR